MIRLTRLRHGEGFYLNPDLFERVDTHVDTVIRLIDGTEYVVVETGDEIARRIAEYRARIIAVAAVLQANVVPNADSSGDAASDVAPTVDRVVGELAAAEPNPSSPGASR